MNLTSRITTFALSAGLALIITGCTFSPGYSSTQPPAQPIDIAQVQETDSNNYPSFDFDRPSLTLSPITRPDSGYMNASNVSFADRNVRPDTGSVSLIGLYGEVAPNQWSAGDPFDGERNLSQVSFADEGACFDPDIDFSGKWIIFASTRHRDTSDLYIKSATGKTITQITSDPADDLMPAFDPQGTRIAFASNRSGNWNIYVKALEASPAMQITSSQDDELHPTWSPDGRYIAFCKLGAQSGRWEIWAVDVQNPGVQRFLDYGLFPQWSPDIATSKILFQRSRQRGSRLHSIWTLDFINGEAMYPTEVVSSANSAVINPTWSPDGSRIAFVTVIDPDEDMGRTPAQSDVWVVNIDGTNRTMLTNGQFANFQPVWSSTGSVYFVSNRSGVENIWAVTTTNLRSLDPNPRQEMVTADPELVGPPHQP